MTEVSVDQPPRPLRVGMIGYAFMGAVHAQAWRNAHRFFDLPLTPELTVVAGRDETRCGRPRSGSAVHRWRPIGVGSSNGTTST